MFDLSHGKSAIRVVGSAEWLECTSTPKVALVSAESSALPARRRQVRSGHGELKYADGSTYVGEWLNDVRSGNLNLQNSKKSIDAPKKDRY